MSIIRKISERIYYCYDSLKATSLKVKIEHFSLNHAQDNIIVVYRLGRQKLLNKMDLVQFENEYFEKISHFDRYKLTKFSTLQHVLLQLFSTNVCPKNLFTHFIQEQIKHEQF